MTIAAIMPLPEELPEISFAGVLAGHRIRMIEQPDGLPIPLMEKHIQSLTAIVHEKPEEEHPIGRELVAALREVRDCYPRTYSTFGSHCIYGST